MSAATLIERWIAERDRLIEAQDKGADIGIPQSITLGSWNGSSTERGDLQREASLLRFLLREVESAAEVEAAIAAAPVVVADLPERDAARAILRSQLGPIVLDSDTAAQAADAVLDALGWPS